MQAYTHPLRMFLVALFFCVHFARSIDRTSLFQFGLLTALAAVNRMDALLLYMSCLLCRTVVTARSQRGSRLVADLLPFATWQVFSLV